MKTSTPLGSPHGRRQRGAVAIMLGLSILVLFGFMALAIDLGRTYVVRTELQNAADAAALAGAKQLDQTAARVCCGVDSAVTRAINMAAQNNFKFSAPVAITIANLSVGSCPDDGCMVPASSITSDAAAAGRTFLKVDIPSGALATFFAVVPTTAAGTGTPSTSTYGRAVAGRFVNDVTPIGVCAIDPATPGGRRPVAGGLPDELTEYGFRRGVSYNTFNLGSVSGGSSDTYLLDPIGKHSDPCVPPNSNNVNTAQFVCGGTSATISTTPTLVWGNTGIQAMPTEKALNSRFGDAPPSQCITSQAQPDTNIRDYPCTGGACPPQRAPINLTALPNTWMDPTSTTTPNTRQTLNLAGITSLNDYGVLWSYSRAVKAVGSSPNATPGLSFTPADWPNLYSTPALSAETSYPGGLTGTTASPYSQGSGPYYKSGGINAAAQRRVLNLAIVNCSVPIGNGSCLSIPIVGIGRFFMQVPAVLTGGPSSRHLYVEFGGLIEPIPDSVIRLYR